MQKIDFVNAQQPALNDTNLNLMQDYIEMAINAQVSGDTLPVGVVLPYAGATSIPVNWLLCDGREISRAEYPQLYIAIGIRYGDGDGSTTFNLPDFRGRIPVGQDIHQTEFNLVGKTGGEKTHTLTVEEMPAHNHSTNIGTALSTDSGGYRVGESGVVQINDNISRNSDSQGGGQPHNILQPYITQKYIIKAFQTAGTVAQIVNTHDISSTNAYSASYINGLHTYSTTEKRVGTWIDGKPIYRKVYTATDSSGFTNDINVPIGFTTWDEVVTLRGIITAKSNEIFPLPSINYDGTSIYGRQLEIISKTGSWQPNTFYIVNRNPPNDDNKTKKYVIVFEYTKTTD